VFAAQHLHISQLGEPVDHLHDVAFRDLETPHDLGDGRQIIALQPHSQQHAQRVGPAFGLGHNMPVTYIFNNAISLRRQKPRLSP